VETSRSWPSAIGGSFFTSSAFMAVQATGDERVGATMKRAYADATASIEQNQRAAGTDAH